MSGQIAPNCRSEGKGCSGTENVPSVPGFPRVSEEQSRSEPVLLPVREALDRSICKPLRMPPESLQDYRLRHPTGPVCDVWTFVRGIVPRLWLARIVPSVEKIAGLPRACRK